MNNDFEFVESIIKSGIPDAMVLVEDMTGTKDHLAITVVSDAFEGKIGAIAGKIQTTIENLVIDTSKDNRILQAIQSGSKGRTSFWVGRSSSDWWNPQSKIYVRKKNPIYS